MKICPYCGFQNWNPMFVKTPIIGTKVILCDDCSKRIDNSPAQCDPLLGHNEIMEIPDSDIKGRCLCVGILSSNRGKLNE